MPSVKVTWDTKGGAALEPAKLKSAIKRALKKSGRTALRDMRSEASKRIRQRKRIRSKYITRALTLAKPKGGGDIAKLEWSLKVRGEPVPLIAYPNRQTKKGVQVEVNRGKKTVVAGSFLATMRSGHQGVFKRRGKGRLPIKELLGSRPVDALLHEGEADAIAERGAESFSTTFGRLFALEVAKASTGEGG